MSKPVLSVRDLVIEIPTRKGVLRPVDGVSLDIAKGEILGVVGESGAGKSLTGNAVIGLLEPPGRVASGEIRFQGERIDALPPDKMRRLRGFKIGMIFQDPLTSLNPLYRVGDQLTETLRTHVRMSQAKAKARAIELLEEVGIPAPEKRFSQYPHEFSGGMRQRVVIALALAHNPELIIADEPTTALDVSVQAQIIALLKRLAHDYDAAVMLVSHNMGVIAETCDRVAVMYAGRIAEIGPVEHVVRHPNHPYTQGLMASIPRIEKRASSQDREALAHIEGAMPRPGSVPPGCAFHPRCPHRFAPCDTDQPDLMDGPGSRAACWLLTQESTQ